MSGSKLRIAGARRARRTRGALEQKSRAGDRHPGAVSVLFRNAGKERADRSDRRNVEASNLWSFFQAKTVRMTMVRTATEQLKLTAEAASDPATRTAMEKQIEAWQKTAARYDSEPETHEGRKELAERAKEAEENRNTFLAKYHAYEIASAAFQIGIVLASAAVITEIIALAWLAGLLGAGGLAVMALGILAPHVLHSL